MHPNEMMAAPLAAVVADQANPKVSALREVGEGNAMHPHSSPEFSSFLRLSQYTLQELPNNSVLIISNLVLVVLLASYCLYTRWQSPQAHDDVRKHISGPEMDESMVFGSSSRDHRSGQYIKGLQRSYTADEMTGMLMNAQVQQQSQSEQAHGSSSAKPCRRKLPASRRYPARCPGRCPGLLAKKNDVNLDRKVFKLFEIWGRLRIFTTPSISSPGWADGSIAAEFS